MTDMLKVIKLACAAVGLLMLAGCSDREMPESVKEEGQTVYPVIRLSVSEMEMAEAGRAAAPMSPDVEKYVRTIAAFEFDNEGLHTKGPTTYHFIDFVNGTVDGVASDLDDVDKTDHGIVEFQLTGLPFESRSNGMLCLVANVLEDSVKVFYDKYRDEGQSYGNITFEQFKKWSLPFDYEKKEGVSYDETVSGHLKTMYMFGYYQGEIDSSKPEEISVDLGRLASRLDISIVNETGEALTKRLGYHFDDVCHRAYFFPIKMSLPPTYGVGLSRTVICSGDVPVDDAPYIPKTFPVDSVHTRYFYVAAHSAADESEATKLHLFYDSHVMDNDMIDAGGKTIKIPMCNVSPSEAASVTNGYSLSRNTRYHFTIRLRKKNGTSTASMSRSQFSPNDIIVYLPD